MNGKNIELYYVNGEMLFYDGITKWANSSIVPPIFQHRKNVRHQQRMQLGRGVTSYKADN
ncbi:MAG: hypothetical protein Fur0044_27950 [Anaerolineae bacterium]